MDAIVAGNGKLEEADTCCGCDMLDVREIVQLAGT